MSVGDDRIFEVVEAVHNELDVEEKDTHRAICDIINRFRFHPSEPNE